MVKINGDKFEVFDLDTKKSFLDRLALKIGTLPLYLYFPDGFPDLQESKDIEVEDLLTTIKNSSISSESFGKLYEEIKTKVKQNKIQWHDVLTAFVVYNKELNEAPSSFVHLSITNMQQNIDDGGYFPGLIKIKEIWNNRVSIKNTYKIAIEHITKKTIRQLKIFKRFETISEGIPYTDFQLLAVTFQFAMDLPKDISLMELFNRIRLNATVPFATIHNFYKILKDFIPPEEWAESEEYRIKMYALEKIDSTNTNIKDFTETTIMKYEDTIYASINMSTEKGNLSKPKFLKRFLSVFEGFEDIKTKQMDETKVSGVFHFPKQTLQKKVFADIVMNNPLFSMMMAINESQKTSKNKSEEYIYFDHPSTGKVSAVVTEKVSHLNDRNFRAYGAELFPLKERYIRVKIRADNIKAAEKFQKLFSRLIVIYNEEYDSIVNFYKNFIPNFDKEEKIEIPKQRKMMLKDVAPEIFVKGYPRKCRNPPEILNNEEAEEAIEQGQQVMVFPKPGSHITSRNYVCGYDDAKFPGLRMNPLENRDIIQYLPCCYRGDHMDNKGSVYRHYYYDEPLSQKNKTKQNIITTNKIVSSNSYGTIPDRITKMFGLITADESYEFIRQGMFRNKSSFLNCVLEALNIQTNILKYNTESKRARKISLIRHEMSSEENASVCLQTMFDFTTDEIEEAIRNPEVYFNPRYFIPLIEMIYDCNIFLFNRNMFNETNMVLPNHLKAFLKNKRSAKSIFIYEHLGSESDHAEYPQCELIVARSISNEDNITRYFPPSSVISKGAEKFFEKLRMSYVNGEEVPLTVFPNLKPYEQGVDSYGKCRMLRIKYKDNDVTILTSPMPPLQVSNVTNWVVTYIDPDEGMELFNELNVQNISQTSDGYYIKEISGMIGNVNISMPVQDGPLFDDIPVTKTGINFPEDEVSKLEIYNKSKKLARYISEYMFWLYSQFIRDKGDKVMSLESMNQFQKSKMQVIPNYDYDEVTKTFSLTSSLIKGGKLVVNSEEALKRLIYLLRIMCIRQPNRILTYCERSMIDEFYVDITDFDNYTAQVILEGEESVNKWITEQGIQYVLHTEVQLGTIYPYFLRIPLIKNVIFIAQNTDSIGKASTICRYWFQKGYNPGYDAVEDKKIIGFYLYAYQAPDEIKSYNIEGEPFDYKARIIGYKIGKLARYTVLLPMS